jgi:hypothetical protein
VSAPAPPWSGEYLAFIQDLTPDDVLRCEGPHRNAPTPESRREWLWIVTAQRLVECHGHAGALARLNGYGHE